MINWVSLTEALGSDPDDAQIALALILGEENLRNAVDAYITFQGGYYVAWSVIGDLRSEAAHDRCLEIWKSDPDVERRRGAVELFPVVVWADDLSLIGELLSEPDPLVPWSGIRSLSQLAYAGEIGERNSGRYLRHFSEIEGDGELQLDQELAFAREFLAGLDPAAAVAAESAARRRGKSWSDGPCVESIDWDWVHRTLRTGNFGGTGVAQQALELVIGETRFRDAVDWCVDGRPGANLARTVLRDVRPPSAGRRCIEIFRSEQDPQRRQSAIEILCLVAVNDQLYVVEELFNDADPIIQEYGAAILETLVETRLRSDPDPEPVVVLAEMHSNERVREKAQTIRREWIDWP
jgi:hypothetical protein